MIDFEPKYITFDCYGTLTHFQMCALTRELSPTTSRRTGYEPSTPYYGYHEVTNLSGVPPLLGLAAESAT